MFVLIYIDPVRYISHLLTSYFTSFQVETVLVLEDSTEVRTICFRFINNKLHCNTSVSWFDPTVSAACSLCHDPLEDINHLLITCSFKWSVRQGVLSRFVSYLEFRPEDVESILKNLSRYEFVDNSRLLRICSQALLYIWRAHWRYIFDGTQFLPQQIVSTIFKNFNVIVYIKSISLSMTCDLY